MEKINVKVSGLGKVAFTVGFGLTVGKYVGELVNNAIAGTILGLTKSAAKNGVKTMQDVCDVNNIAYGTNKEQ